MYKIRIDKDRLNELSKLYLKKYKDNLRQEINGFLCGGSDFTFTKFTREKPARKFIMKVDSSKSSFTTTFLQECNDPNKTLLDDLLIGDITRQLEIIEWIENNCSLPFEKLTADKANKLGYVDGQQVDDFNSIMHKIFVERSFEGDKKSVYALALDKDEFVKDLGIRICPYCGRSYIYRVEKQGKNGMVSVKPQLDHFLPKSSYPFLGMNFYNLIPCCTQCNMAPCKLDNDPLDDAKKRVAHLIYPYDFDNNKVRFFYQMKSPDTYKPESFDVMVGYKDKDLKKGYNGFLAIDKLYAGHSVEVCNMHLKARAFGSATNGFYKGLGMNGGVPLTTFVQAVLGFNLNQVEENRQLMYKFYRDTFMQMLNRSTKLASIYYVDFEGKEIVVSLK